MGEHRTVRDGFERVVVMCRERVDVTHRDSETVINNKQSESLRGHLVDGKPGPMVRLRLFPAAARLARHARQTRLRFTAHWAWTSLITTALSRLHSD